jgi:N-acyl-D-aspartate/D-glutamate deacylase
MRADAWKDDRAIIGASDAGAHLDMIDTFAFSTQVLSQGVRERRLLELEDAVYRMTKLPAETFGLRQRGMIAEGYHADVVVFDPDTIACGPLHSRNDLPNGAERLFCEAIGVAHVIVNGREILDHGKPTGNLPGTVLRSGRDTETVPIPATLNVATAA